MIALSRTSLKAELCRRSFYKFVQTFWDVIIKDEPVWNWHIKYLCHEMQVGAERVFAKQPKEYDLVINVPPGSSKSTICSIMFPAWTWTRMRHARTIGASYAHSVASDNSRKGRMVVESDKYRELFPEVQIREDQNTKGFYETKEGGDRIAVGAGGAITGRHAHFILIDDPINPVGARSEAEIKNTNQWIEETLSTRKVDKAVTWTVLIMQRLHQEDPTQKMLDKADEHNKVKHICIPGEDAYEIKPAGLKVKYVDGLFDAVRFPRKVLEGYKKLLGLYGYAGQIGQNPVPAGGGMFKVSLFKMGVPPRHFKRIVRYWDKAGTDGGGAYTAGVLMAEDMQGQFWVLDVVRGQWDSFERERIIKQTADNDRLLYRVLQIGIEQEPGSGGKESAQSTMKNLKGHSVRADRPTGDKVVRADPYSTQVNAGNVFVKQGSEWWDDYKAELQLFPFSKFKDQTDASSGAFSLLTSRPRIGALPQKSKEGQLRPSAIMVRA